MFDNTQIITLDPIANWNVSNVTSMVYMFGYTSRLASAAAIENWDVNNVRVSSSYGKCSRLGSVSENNCFAHMFYPYRPNDIPIFTSRPGTWNSTGTYIPNP